MIREIVNIVVLPQSHRRLGPLTLFWRVRPINCEGPAGKANFLGGILVWCLNNHIPALQPLFIPFIIRQQLVSVCFLRRSRARHTKRSKTKGPAGRGHGKSNKPTRALTPPSLNSLLTTT